MEFSFWLVLLGLAVLFSLGYYASIAPNIVGIIGGLMLILLSLHFFTGIQYASGENTTILPDNSTSMTRAYSTFTSPLFGIILLFVGVLLIVDIATNMTGMGGW